jgi:sulfur-oxidizing protein SoxA
VKKIVTTFALFGAMLAAVSPAQANPEQDRLNMVKTFKEKFPDLKPEDYVNGALSFNKDALNQYKSIMEFPPYDSELEKAEKMWNTPMKSGKTLAECLPNGGKMIAGNYPMFDNAKGKVVTLEMVVNDCRVANGESAWKYGDPATMGLLTAHLRKLSDGMAVNVKVEGEAAEKAFNDGKATWYARKGQLNFSCSNCHVLGAGERVRSEILSPIVGQATHWPVFRAGTNLTTLQTRYKGCHASVRHAGDDPGSERYNNLEYFHTYMSNGLPMQAAIFRK